MWKHNPVDGVHSPKIGYEIVRATRQLLEVSWWHTTIWNINCPLEIKIFMRLALRNRIPVWSFLQNKVYEGPGRCALCQAQTETIEHPFIECSYILRIWKLIRILSSLNYECKGSHVTNALSIWNEQQVK